MDNPLAQRTHFENTGLMLLVSFVAGLNGVPCRQVRYAKPHTMDQALKIAFSVQETEKQEKFNESFYTRFDKSVKLQSHSPSRTRHEDWKPLS
jgi:hypothetical protein